MSVTSFPTIPLDANGTPREHAGGIATAAQSFYDMVNEELPGGIESVHMQDATWIAERIVGAYLAHLKRHWR